MRILRGALALSVAAIIAISTATPLLAVDQTKNGSVDVSGIVPGPPPATAPVITLPVQDEVFNQKNIDVQGDCTPGLTVRIFRNAIFAGSALCQPDGSFSLKIDLTEGRNDLIARQYDFLDQSSPDSDTVSVFYNPPQSQPSLPGEINVPPSSSSAGQTNNTPPSQVAQFQLIIDYDYSFRGVGPNVPLHLPIHFSGGTAPYAIAVIWGDGNTTVVSRESAEQFFVDHTYAKPGAYNVKIRISDKNGSTAYLQFVLIVNGKDNQAGNLFGLPFNFNVWLSTVWPAFAFSAAGFMGGFFFSDYWKRRKQKKNQTKSRSKRKK